MNPDAAFAELPNDADVLGGPADLLLFEPGTVGWDGIDVHFDTEDGVTLVRVTLVRDLVRVAQYLLKTPQAVDDGRQALASYVAQGVQTWSNFLVPPTGAS